MCCWQSFITKGAEGERAKEVKREREVKQAVTKRMHLTSLEDVVNDALERFPRRPVDLGDEKVRESLREWLTQFADSLALHLEMDFQSAAKRGIEEAAKLIRDPEYYETVKKRRQSYKRQEEECRKQQEEERERHRRGEYTSEERERKIAYLKSSIEHSKKWLALEQEQLLKLESGAALLEDVGIDWGEADF